jgi:phage repressor protein C with HTH and peptisase S24 domain
MTLSERIRMAMTAAGISQTELARACGVKPPSIHGWLTGKAKFLRGENLLLAARALGVSQDWLATGKGEMHQPAEIAPQPTRNGIMRVKSGEIEIPQYSDVAGGMGGGVTLRDQPGAIHGWRVTPEWISKNIKSHSGAGNLCIVTGFGNSIQPLYNPGDPLIIDRGIKSVDSDATYFFRVGDEGFIKILQRIPGEGIRVISKNKDYETWTIKPDMDFEVFGQVLKAWCGTDV